MLGVSLAAASVGAASGCGDSTEDGGPTSTDAATDGQIDRVESPPDAGSDVSDGDVSDGDVPEPPFDCGSDASLDPPRDLRCTGLYERWTSKSVRSDVRAYTPAFKLWSDGAEKHRFILLLAGTKIDTTNMNGWRFPIGTKLWKEFVLDGKRRETRFFWKVGAAMWARTTYRWADDESTAIRLDDGATTNDAGDPDAGGYEIPAVAKCDQCHAGSEDKVLGFEAVSLGAAGASGYTLADLVSEGRLTVNPPTTTLTVPDDGHGSRDALGWLHGNCGTSCHNANPAATCAFKGMHLKLSFEELASGAAVTSLGAYTTTHGVAATIPASGYFRIAPGDVAHSAVHYLANHRDNTSAIGQMPPIDSHRVDPTGVGYLGAWITSMP